MLTGKQRNDIQNINECDARLRRSVRKRVVDKTVIGVKDIAFVFKHADKFPNLQEKISVKDLQDLIDAYFVAYKKEPKFFDPKVVVDLLDENAKLKRKNATMMQEMGDLVHRIEHFKYIAKHATSLLEEVKQLQQEEMVMP